MRICAPAVSTATKFIAKRVSSSRASRHAHLRFHPLPSESRLLPLAVLLAGLMSLSATAQAAITPSPPARASGSSATTSTSTCSGLPLISGTNLQQAINNRGSGTTFCLAPGTYHVRSVIVPKSYDVLIGAPGTVLTGDG